MTFRTDPNQVNPEDGSDGEGLSRGSDGVVQFIPSSRPVIVLAPGSDATDVPAGTPDRSLIIVEA